MPEPTYRIAQRLHERRAAVGLETYGRHLDADSKGCMIVHALEEAADQVNYLIAEIQRRQRLMKWLRVISDEKGPWADWAWGWFVDFGGEAALAKYDEILGGAEDAAVAPEPRDEALRENKARDSSARMFEIIAETARRGMADPPDTSALIRIWDLCNASLAHLAAIRGAL